MKLKNVLKFLTFTFVLFLSSSLAAQTIKGKVTDSSGEGLPYVNVIEKENTSNGVISSDNGEFSITVESLPTSLLVSSMGFETKTVNVANTSYLTIVMNEDNTLDEIVVIGSRNKNRTLTETPVPVDIINVTELASKGPQTSINEILNYVAPSFTSQTQTVSDGTDHVDPASLRGLGPDQVLVLINGKRRHTSSLMNINGTVGAGSVGTDMNAIPVSAIKRIEVLRDGAAAQYGSDAIAGVINIVLQDVTNKLSLSVTTGANVSSGSNHQDGGYDGEKIQIDANYGLDLGKKGGYINFAGSIGIRRPALRNATNLEQIYDIANAVENAFTTATGKPISDMTAADYQSGAKLLGSSYLSEDNLALIEGLSSDVNGGMTSTDLKTLRDALNENGNKEGPTNIGIFETYQDLDNAQFALRGKERNDFRFRVGTARLREGKFFTNLSLPVSENAEVYSFGGISFRQGLGYGFLREPWRPKGNTASNPNGFLPGIQSDIVDKSFAVGIKGQTEGGWDVDFSNTYGQNSFVYTVVNTSNASLKAASPTNFSAGSHIFSQNTTNLDLSKYNEDFWSGLNLAFGAEYRVDNFEVFAGKENSYTHCWNSNSGWRWRSNKCSWRVTSRNFSSIWRFYT